MSRCLMRPLSSFTRKLLAVVLLCPWMAAIAPASASVVITGTRVIYPGGDREKSVQLTNEDAFPNVVQAWIDVNNPDSTPDSADAPFVVTPPMARLEPKAGQSLRIVFTGQGLPQDRESLFYLNVLQIPPISQANKDQNQLLVMLRNRLKLFYRPRNIPGKPEDLPGKLQFQLQKAAAGWAVEARNPTGYYASVAACTLAVGGKDYPLHTEMLPPDSSSRWAVERATEFAEGTATVHCKLVNDFGAQVDVNRDVVR
ncbi:molecular chaperone [Dyella soli]|uniref:Molecular chaperone n=2 Tax=Dyella soli TaxID=522319 RepID=A0A4R0YGP4_9GAMM|nr:molecular chaperone [Dyella soli]